MRAIQIQAARNGREKWHDHAMARVLLVSTLLFATTVVGLAVALGLAPRWVDTDCSGGADPDGDASVDLPVPCDPSEIELSDYPQWQHEEGYWIGEYSLYGADGDPSVSSSWNYPYDHYRGFITGNVRGNKYRQRNVFMYPPQLSAACPGVTGDGACGINGQMKLFEADQVAATCSNNPLAGGDIEGPYGSLSYTTTELIGRNNSLLYQVWMTKESLAYYEGAALGNSYGRCKNISAHEWYCGASGPDDPVSAYPEDRLMQSQLTTLTRLPSSKWLRTRTAQGFQAFSPPTIGATTYASYYRETQVSEAEFWAEFNATRASYAILESDTCMWLSKETGGVRENPNGPGFASCEAHLDQSFEL